MVDSFIWMGHAAAPNTETRGKNKTWNLICDHLRFNCKLTVEFKFLQPSSPIYKRIFWIFPCLFWLQRHLQPPPRMNPAPHNAFCLPGQDFPQEITGDLRDTNYSDHPSKRRLNTCVEVVFQTPIWPMLVRRVIFVVVRSSVTSIFCWVTLNHPALSLHMVQGEW